METVAPTLPAHEAVPAAGHTANRRLAGVAAGLGAAAIWGGMYVVSKYVLAFVPPVTLVRLRLVAGTLILGLVAVATRAAWVRRRDLPFMALLGFVGLCISIVAQFAGTRLSTAANGALITSAVPAFMLVFTWPLLGERPTARRVVGLILATLGVLVATAFDPSAGRNTTGNLSHSVLVGNALLGATLPSILFFSQPVVGGLLGALLLGERLGAAFFLDGTLVALAVFVTSREAR